MKDSYSFDIDRAGLDVQFDRHREAYMNIFEKLGMDAFTVEASSGAMGGKESVEFMVASDVGEDEVAHCAGCGYAANLEKATSTLQNVEDPVSVLPTEMFDTPGVRTIADLEVFTGGAAAARQIKTLVYVVDDEPLLVLMRGDHDVQEQKLMDMLRTVDVRQAQADEIVALLGADAGSLGAVGVEDVRIIADVALKDRTSMTTGANVNDKHLRNVSVDRDIIVTQWADVRGVREGDICPSCGDQLSISRTIEVGHIFKLGTFYAEPLGLSVLDENGKSAPIVMGSYGIGIERNMAAAVEANHDDKGIVWPMTIAPFHVIITVIRPDDDDTMSAANTLYAEFEDRGIEVLLDDRAERPGVKFNDAELVGIPLRLTVGPRGVTNGIVELSDRRTGESTEIALDVVVDSVADLVKAAL
jgi:prolyl-tRNA synthetase